MADKKQLEILRTGVQAWNDWRVQHIDVRINLSRADLNRLNLERANLNGANLMWANFEGAVLRSADIANANLYAADLSTAILSEAILFRSNLTSANLAGARMRATDLRHTIMTRAVINETVFADLDLRSVIGLDSCIHYGPSIVDHRTMLKSSPLPLFFVRGCGLPDSLIDYLPSLVGSAIQFYSCFISYSTHDEAFADRLHADLQNKGVRCWFAPHDIQSGKKVHEQIDEAIRIHDRLLLILSDHSMNSEWVKTEIANARQKELKESRRVLFPISVVPFQQIKTWKNFDADTSKDSAREIREYFIPDFSNWKDHDSYMNAFDRLLKDLRIENAAS